ncbi:MAG: hypothetical protein U5K53_08460 [Halanaerobiales bacterium]|nr:hypothetical protein [Halanaerobiales bacterium]
MNILGNYVRITFAGEKYLSENFRETDCRLKSEIIVEGVKKGAIEVFDLDKKREDSENSFLKEERTLIQGISRILSNEFLRRETKKQLEQKSNILQSLTNKTPGAVYQYQLFPDGSSSFLMQPKISMKFMKLHLMKQKIMPIKCLKGFIQKIMRG